MVILIKSFVLNNYHQHLPVSFDNCQIDSWQKAKICFIIEIGALEIKEKKIKQKNFKKEIGATNLAQ